MENPFTDGDPRRDQWSTFIEDARSAVLIYARHQHDKSKAVRDILLTLMDVPVEGRRGSWPMQTVLMLRHSRPNIAWPENAPSDVEIIDLLRAVHRDDAVTAMSRLVGNWATGALRWFINRPEDLGLHPQIVQEVATLVTSTFRAKWAEIMGLRVAHGELSSELAAAERDETIERILAEIAGRQEHWKASARQWVEERRFEARRRPIDRDRPTCVTREGPDFWRDRHVDFEALATRQTSVLKQPTKKGWLRARCRFSATEGEFGRCRREGGFDGRLISKFDDLATQAGYAVGCPPDVEPVAFWVYCLSQDLLKTSDPEIRAEFAGGELGGVIEGLLESSMGYCSRLAARAERQQNVDLSNRGTGAMETEGFRKDIRIRGPEDMELLIYPSGDFYFWKLHNGGLDDISELRVGIEEVSTFNSKKQAFRKPVPLRFRWSRIEALPAGSVTKEAMFLRIKGDRLQLGNSDATPELAWPNGDQTAVRLWRLSMKVTGPSKEWPIELCLRWTVGAKNLELMQYREAAPEDQGEGASAVSSEVQQRKPADQPAAALVNRHVELLLKIVAEKHTTIESWAGLHRLARTTVFAWKACRLAGEPLKGKVGGEKATAIEEAIEKDARELGLSTRTDSD